MGSTRFSRRFRGSARTSQAGPAESRASETMSTRDSYTRAMALRTASEARRRALHQQRREGGRG
jgi:hypothetical protein